MRTHTQLKIFFDAVLIALTTLAIVTAPAQVGGAELSKSPAVVAFPPDAHESALVPHLAGPRIGNAERVAGSRKHMPSAHMLTPQDSLSFLAAAAFDSGGAGTSSVAVADLNGDGKLDLVVLSTCSLSGCSNSQQVGVLLGNGDGTFKTAVIYGSGGASLTGGSVAIADVNGDGKPDIVVANSCGADRTGCQVGSVGVLLGNGDGTFKPAVAYGSGGYFDTSVVIADVNGDGRPDLLLSNNCADINCGSDGVVGVLLGKGHGTFQSAVTYSSGGLVANSVAVADVNGDGKPDLLVANQGSNTVGVLLGNGDGTFRAAVGYGSGGDSAESVAVADVNGDSKPDLVVATFGNTLGVLLGNGDGTFQMAVPYATAGISALSAAVADVNGDGKPDLLAVNSCVDSNCHTGVVSILLGNGDGTFQSAVTYDSGGYGANSIAVADVNGDGRLDLVIANFSVDFYDSAPGVATVLLNNSGPPTTTTMVSSLNPAAVQQNVTYTATVKGKPGKAVTGTVTFRDGGSDVATVTLAGNQAAYSTSYRVHGVHSLTAIYSGDLHNVASTSAALAEYIGKFPVLSRTTLNTSGSPSPIGQAVTFTASVAPGDSRYGAIPSGEPVTFYDGTNILGSVALSNGSAAYSTPSLSAKKHTIKVIYRGDAIFMQSAAEVAQVVVGYPTMSSLSSSLNPSTYGQKVTWTATVTSSGSITPTGTVKFTWSGRTIGLATLNGSGSASLTKSNLNTGSYPLAAVYMGDTENSGSTSTVLNQVVHKATSTAALTSSLNPSTQGQAVTFAAKISSPTVTPTGAVTFTAGKTVLGTVQLSGGKAKLTISSLAVGSTKVTATYYGNSNIAKSLASIVQTVH
jgi:hypothetical protein